MRVGDDSRINIKGKGSISFIDEDGEKRTMTEVYFIPDLKSNIISLGQATESGCDIRMKEDYLTLHDHKGKLLVTAKRAKNRLYKVRMGLTNATYLINRVATRALKNHTPYEILRHKKPNIGHLRIFGCIAFARSESPHLKKLEDRSRMLVHLGTEPGSKAYRLYDPTHRKIVVSRDVKFDETKGWNWISNAGTNLRKLGSFTVVLCEHRNHGLTQVEETAEDENETIGGNNRNIQDTFDDEEHTQPRATINRTKTGQHSAHE